MLKYLAAKQNRNQNCEVRTMKKWLSGMLVVVMILTMLTGCGNQEKPSEASGEASGIFYELTGIAPDTTVMTVSGVNITAEEYLYWLSYLCASTEYNILSYNAYYGYYADLINEDDSINWNGEFRDGQTLAQYVVEETESTIRFYTAIELMAQKHNAGLDSEDMAAIATNMNEAIQELGGQEQFDKYLEKLGICQDTFQALSTTSYMFDNLLLQVLEEGNELYLEPENYNKYATYADHILLMTIDATSGKPLDAKEVQTRKARMEEMLSQLQAADDLLTTFKELADAYSEDTGRATNPDGYVFTPGTMVASFEDAAAALEPGQISGVVESDYGYHIILRKDLQEALEADPEQRVSIAETHLTTLLTILSGEATVEVSKLVKDINVAEFYAAYEAHAEELTKSLAQTGTIG